MQQYHYFGIRYNRLDSQPFTLGASPCPPQDGSSAVLLAKTCTACEPNSSLPHSTTASAWIQRGYSPAAAAALVVSHYVLRVEH